MYPDLPSNTSTIAPSKLSVALQTNQNTQKPWQMRRNKIYEGDDGLKQSRVADPGILVGSGFVFKRTYPVWTPLKWSVYLNIFKQKLFVINKVLTAQLYLLL